MDQSTLTQIDFVSTPSATKEIISISSDDDFEEPRPKKKPRKSKLGEKERGQSTLTQFDRDKIFGKRIRQSEVDEDGFHIWDDYISDHGREDAAEKQDERGSELPWFRQDNNDIDNQEVQPEIPETSQVEAYHPSRVACENGRNVQATQKPAHLQTPRRVRFTEVPSSQTPPSTKLSIQSPTRNVDAQRSPLKERSTNVQATAPSPRSPESQNISMRMLEKVRLATRKVPLNDTTVHPSPPMKVAPDHVENEQDGVAPLRAAPRSLRRVSTIQDSQAEEPDASGTTASRAPVKSTPTLERITTVQDSQADDLDVSSEGAVQSPSKPRTLKRTTTIQDSQYDDVELLTDDDGHGYQASHDSDDEDEVEYDNEDDLQATFDPANSALDRDAARFKWTQTQQKVAMVDEQKEDSETDDEDLDRGCRPSGANYIIPASDEPSQELGEPSDPTSVPPVLAQAQPKPKNVSEVFSQKVNAHRPSSRDDSVYESGDVVHREEIEIPSSPPPAPPRPSQFSTVVPTQISQQWPLSRAMEVLRSPQKSNATQSFAVPSSPQKSGPRPPESLQSSPLPLPPWSSPVKHGDANERSCGRRMASKGKSQFKNLVDYSLPPPPPMSSSGRQTPVSSST